MQRLLPVLHPHVAVAAPGHADGGEEGLLARAAAAGGVVADEPAVVVPLDVAADGQGDLLVLFGGGRGGG